MILIKEELSEDLISHSNQTLGMLLLWEKVMENIIWEWKILFMIQYLKLLKIFFFLEKKDALALKEISTETKIKMHTSFYG